MTCAAVVTAGHPKCGREATSFVIGPQMIGDSMAVGIVMAPSCEEHLERIGQWFTLDPGIQAFGGEIMAFPMSAREMVLSEFGPDVWEILQAS